MTDIFENYSVKNESTFKIGGIVKKAAFPHTIEKMVNLLNSNEYDIVLGSCSNILFSSGEIDKNIIFTKHIKDYKFEGPKLTVSCGTKGALISKECRERALTGFEFLIGFPGSFGGMIYMNASAHNQSISDCFVSARLFDIKNAKIINFNKYDMNFSYRKSGLSSGNYILLDAVFELKEGSKAAIEELMQRNIEFRKLRQPSLSFGNAGSIFKNPVNDSAGRLLDLAGAKEEKSGGAAVFEKHANFIINKNNATSFDVVNLMYKMYSKVKEKYTIELEPEIKYIGNEGTEEYKIWELMTSKNIQTTQK